MILSISSLAQASLSKATSSSGMASTAHPLATHAAQSIYKIGGNSIDAAIAASLTLSVVEPSMSGLGGRAQAIVRYPDGRFQGYNGMTEIPRGFVVQSKMANSGYATVATPGLLALLQVLHENHGSLPFQRLIQPAIKYAQKGFTVLPGEASRHQRSVKKIKQNPGMAQAYLSQRKTAVKAGDILKQPTLALTLTRLSDVGPDDFYQGQIARGISTDMARNGGFITLDDLRAYQVLPGRYIHFPYRNYEIHTLAAPAGGGLVAKAMMLLAQYDVSSLSNRSWALLMAQALALSIESMADDYYETDLDQLTDASWARQRLKRIRLPILTDSVNASPIEISSKKPSAGSVTTDRGHTSHFVTADCSGLAVSMTQTLGPLFGAMVATASLGFPYAATMGGYLRTGRQDPGSRPRTAIAPVIVTLNQKIVLALGAAGGIKIPSAIVQALSRYIDQGKNIQDALELPRVHPASTIDKHHKRQVPLKHFQAETTLGGWTPADVDSWRRAGFEVTEINKQASFARIHVLERKNNTLTGAADPDWEGSALPNVECEPGAITQILE